MPLIPENSLAALTVQPLPSPQGPPPVDVPQDPVAQQIGQAGAIASTAGNYLAQQADKLQDQIDESATADALAELEDETRRLLLEPGTGYLLSQRRDAVERRGQILAELDAAKQRAAERLGTPMAQRLFELRSTTRLGEAAWRIDAHAGREAHEWDVQSTTDQIDRDAQAAIDGWGRPDPTGTLDGGYHLHRQSALDQFDRLAGLRGISQSSPDYQAMRQRLSGRIAQGVIGKILSGVEAPGEQSRIAPLERAWDYLQKARASKDLDPETESRLVSQLGKQIDERVGQARAIEALRETGGRVRDADALLLAATQGPEGLTPAQLREARSELDRQGKLATEQRDRDRGDLLDRLKAWGIANPRASFDDWAAANREDAIRTVQSGGLDEAFEWFQKTDRTISNPQVRTDLFTRPRQWWASQTENGIRAKFGPHLSADDLDKAMKSLSEAKGSTKAGPGSVLDQADLDKVRWTQMAPSGFRMLQGDSETPAANRIVFAQWQAEVDRLTDLHQRRDEKLTLSQARELARSESLTDFQVGYAGGDNPRWNWQLDPATRETVGVEIDGKAISLSAEAGAASREEVLGALQEFVGDHTREEADRVLRDLEETDIDPARFDAVVQKDLMRSVGPGVTPNDLARAIYNRRKKGLEVRAQLRAADPGMVSLESMARQFGGTVEEIRGMLATKRIDVAQDDLALGTAEEWHYAEPFSALTAPRIVGISRAAASRLYAKAQMALPEAEPELRAALQRGPLGTGEAMERAQALRLLAEQATPERRDELKARLAELTAARDRFAKDLAENAERWGGMDTPLAQNTKAQIAMLEVAIQRTQTPDPTYVSELWEGWLQEGGEFYESEEGQALMAPARAPTPPPSPMLQLPFQLGGSPFAAPQPPRRREPWELPESDVRSFNKIQNARARYPRLPSLEEHLRMRALRDSLIGPQ